MQGWRDEGWRYKGWRDGRMRDGGMRDGQLREEREEGWRDGWHHEELTYCSFVPPPLRNIQREAWRI